MQASLGQDFNINEFPCSFNLSCTHKLRLTRLRTVKHTLTVELSNGTDCESEIIRKKNLLSFIYFRLDKQEEAVQLSNDLVELTQRRNVATLANRCFILWRNGDELGVRECRNCLKSLKNEEDFHVLFTEAKAEQAYYYSRIGGSDSLMQAETLFSQVVNEVPTNYLWKYGLGLVCRRATHGNILSCSPKAVDVDTSIKKAIQYLFEVADNGDSWLKSMAYSQLINLRQVHKVGKIPKYDVLFRQLRVGHLVGKALEGDGDKIPSVLTQCGKALRRIDIDKSIELLEKSVAIKPSSMSYHFLGKSYKRNAQMQLNKGRLLPGDPETGSVGQSTEGERGLTCLLSGCPGGTETDTVGQSTEGGEETLSWSSGDIETDAVGQSIEGGEELTYFSLWSPGEESEWKLRSSKSRVSRRLFMQHDSNTQVCSPTNLRSNIHQAAESGLPPSEGPSDHLPSLIPSPATTPVDSLSPTNYVPFCHIYRGCHYFTYPGMQPSIMPALDRDQYRPNASLCKQSFQQGLQDNCGYLENTFRDPNILGSTSSCRSSRSSPAVNYGNRGQQRIRQHKGYIGRGQPHSAPHYSRGNFNDDQYGQTSPQARQQHGYHDNKGMYHDSRGRNFTRSFSSPTTAYETNRRYPRARSNSRRRGSADSLAGISLSEHEIIASSRQPSNQVYLNGDDEFVKKAVINLQKAIELSNENFPAILDLGILLNETGNTRDALQYFNKVTNSKLASKSHKVSAISAFEQAGLCYLKLGQAGKCSSEDEEAGKMKMTQAVSLAAELALSIPELQGKTQELWTAFETLMKITDKNKSSPNYFMEKVQLLELAQKHREIIESFKKRPTSTWSELNDKEIASVIKSYHKESKFEDALALQNIISLRPDVQESDWWKTGDLLDLRIKSLLHAAAGRLERATDTPIGLFQQVFQLLFGACFGAQGKNDHNPQAGSYVGDVLIVFNDDEEVDDGPDSSTVTSLGLQQVATSLFGLETERNLKGSSEYGDCRYETQLQEMRKYQVVIIVLGSETRCPKFDAILKNVFVNIDRNESTRKRRTLIIDAGLGDGPIPSGMTHYERFKLTNMSGLRCVDSSPDNEGSGDQLSYVDILTHGFHGDVNDVMRLFCFMVGQKWPGS